ncbi:hypothetical protein [Prosthecodimorpha staleyi]|uniref:Uncharacterized protein n=1 Tax=Prosthecodimorpha staleyi TaxID=2840188 RepID=A0A947D812_9HYPH|nr:hypothetical protein [Prosthecodimorpha staleyi]MBT9292088.1 hypothetical protein [Prosthecodimorpha staleyi]
MSDASSPARRPLRRTLAAVLIALAAASGPARAAEVNDPELTLLYRLALSAEMCGFTVSPKQAEAIGKEMDRHIRRLNLSDDDADALYKKIEADMAAEDWDRICAKTGAWAKTYAEQIRKFGK